MPERRMFAKAIIDSDAFLDMPMSAQTLYFHLSMRADDDGFVSTPRRIQRMIGCTDDDLKLLIAKQYLIAFESGAVVIRHWMIHNYIRANRRESTLCQAERQQLTLNSDGEYELSQPQVNQVTAKQSTKCPPSGQPSDVMATSERRHGDVMATSERRHGDVMATSERRHGDVMATSERLPDSIPTVSKPGILVSSLASKLDNNNNNIIPPIIPSVLCPPEGKNDASETPRARRFTKPTVDEVRALCTERSYHFDPQAFIDHYEANGWRVGRNPMKDWKAAASTWERGWKERNRTTETRTERAPKWG